MFQSITLLTILVVINLLWAGSYTVSKFGMNTMDPLVLVYLRILFSFLIMAGWVIVKRYSFKMERKDLLKIAAAGLMTGISQYLIVKGISLSYATDASLLYVFEPVSGIILAGLILKEKLNWSTGVALLLVLIGLGRLANFDTAAFGFGENGIGFGNLLIVIGLICESFFSIILKPIAHKKPAPLVMAIAFFTAVIFLSFPMAGRLDKLTALNLNDMLVMTYLVVICSVVGYTFWVKTMGKLPVSLMYFVLFVQPIAGPFIASATIGERIDDRVIAGGVFLLSGMLVAIVGYLGIFRKGMKSILSNAS
ncbi:MAG: DMT family transporter [Deltaproteobacteria bacterium]|nr:DMT family transporter [Deltaproteobacteria bacterium]